MTIKDRSFEDIEALRKEVFEELTFEDMCVQGHDLGQAVVARILATVLHEVAEKVGPKGYVTKREFGLLVMKHGLTCLAADLDNKRGNKPNHRPDRSLEDTN